MGGWRGPSAGVIASNRRGRDQRLVGVGGNSAATAAVIERSVDGLAWVAATTVPAVGVLYGVDWDPVLNRLVAVGKAGAIVTSDDGGDTWTSRTSGTANDLWDVAWWADQGLWIAVGVSGTILTSPTGVTWTTRTPGASTDIFQVGIGEGGTLACIGAAVSASKCAETSTNGTAWTRRDTGATASLKSLARLDSQDSWVAVQGTAVRKTFDATGAWSSAFTAGGTDGAVGVRGQSPVMWVYVSSSEIFTSPDTTTWTSRTPVIGNAPGPNAIYYFDFASIWVVGFNSNAGQTMTSTDNGATWTGNSSVYGGGTGRLMGMTTAIVS